MCLCVVVLLSSLFLCGSGTSPQCVCVRTCVCKHPGLFVCQSGCWQLCLILGRWITASCSPDEAVGTDQREKSGKTT